MYKSKFVVTIFLVLISSCVYPKTLPKNTLEIRSVDLVENIYVGYSKTLLEKGLLLDLESLETNNWIIYGHRFSNDHPLEKYLRDLDKVSVGDEINLYLNNKKYTFRVIQTLTISPSDLWIIAPTISKNLTIITCTPIINPKDRLVVISKLVGVE